MISIHLTSLSRTYQGHDLTLMKWMLSFAYPALFLFACRAIEKKLGTGPEAVTICFFGLPVRCMVEVEVERQEIVEADKF
jgi:hypothetical protein